MKASRVCPKCGKHHNTVVENTQTGEVESYVPNCMDCLMAKTVFKPLTDQVILEWDGTPHFDGFDPPPWEINAENGQKTEGWIERQRWEREQKEE